MFKNQELRKLPTGSLHRISETLEPNGDWKKVLALIPKDLTSEKFEPKYRIEHIRAIQEYAQKTNKLCAEILFDEWGTSGRVRPTLHVLQNIIIQAGIYRAADEIALILQEPPPPRPTSGPAAKVEIDNFTQLLKDINGHPATASTAQVKTSFSKKLMKSIGIKTTATVKSRDPTSTQEHTENYSEAPSMSANIPNMNILLNPSTSTVPQLDYPAYPIPRFHIDTAILENKALIQFEYEELKKITSNFSDVLIYGPNGPSGKIGSGGFGDVFAGSHLKHGPLAIKKFRDLSFLSDNPHLVTQTFNAEVKCLAQLRHVNIVPIVGYSIQDQVGTIPCLCIVTQYIDGGSLEQNLAAKRLTEKQRLEIMLGTANGLRYIHNRDEFDKVEEEIESNFLHYIHGDVKSANILLIKDNYQPKLCDFGLAKQFKTTIVTPCVMGTTPYMSPERLQGTNTQKADIYSFGIVLLELLTGLQSLVKKNKGIVNLQDHIAEVIKEGDISELFDPVVEKWTKAMDIYGLAKKCLVYDYAARPTIDEVCDELAKVLEEFKAESEKKAEKDEKPSENGSDENPGVAGSDEKPGAIGSDEKPGAIGIDVKPDAKDSDE